MVMDYYYQESTHVPAYSPPCLDQTRPHFPFYPPHRNPSFDHLYISSFHANPAVLPPVDSIYPEFNHGGKYESQASVYGEDYVVGSVRLPTHYHDQNWGRDARYVDYRSHPESFLDSRVNILPTNAAQQFVTSDYNQNLATNRKIWHQGKLSSRKKLKKTKSPQSFRCDACKIVCDTEDVLKKHRLGKKHKHNLEKLKTVISGQATSTPNLATSAPESLNTNKPLNEQTKKKKPSPNADDLETKKKRVIEVGAAIDAVRTCSICMVVCNSETVFQYHLAGKKHAAMVKQHASGLSTESSLALAS